ncbi:hypothetical protein D9M69_304480 [compost metagenome]
MGYRIQGDAVGKLTIEGVGRQIQVGRLALVAVDRALTAIATDKGTHRTDQVAVGVLVGAGRVKIDGDNIVFDQAFELVCLGYAVLVQILPDTHIGKLGILRVEYAIGIAVQVAQRIETIAGLLSIGFDGIHTEKLTAIFDDPVSIAIQYEKAVITLDPASSCLQAVAIEVECHANIG